MRRILVLEDNRLERKFLMNILSRKFGNRYTIDEASEGSEAVHLLSNNDYQLVITDLVMPGKIEGMDLIRTCLKKYPEIPIIAISGNQPFYLYLAKRLGVKAVFTKPLDIELFIHTSEQLLSELLPENRNNEGHNVSSIK